LRVAAVGDAEYAARAVIADKISIQTKPTALAVGFVCSGLRLQTCAGRFISPASVMKALVFSFTAQSVGDIR